MTRTFAILSAFILLLLLATITAGVLVYAQEPSPLRDDVYIVHFFLGLTTSLVVLLVHCLIFTYFLGTGRWVKEVTLAYQLPDEPLHKTTRELKRATFPPALFAMLITIATAAAGAGAQLQDWPWYVHALFALATVAVNLWAFRVELRNVTHNAEIIQQVLVEVDKIRLEQGLNTNAEALLDEETSVAEGKRP